MNGHKCDRCGHLLEDDDFIEYGKWDYVCPNCEFKYSHSPLIPKLHTFTAKYYDDDNQIVIYNSRGKLVEFPLDDRGEWGLPPLVEWKKNNRGKEIEFYFKWML